MEGLLIVAGLVVGLLIGFFVARSTSPERGQVKELEAALVQEKESLNNYRDKVSQHFSHTAELVEALAANSREIYSHLALGSQELCGSDVAKSKENENTASISISEEPDQNQEATQEKLKMESTVPEKDEHESLHAVDILPQSLAGNAVQNELKNDDFPTDPDINKSSGVCVDIEQHRKKEDVA